MNKGTTLALWAQGKDAWNAWAKVMLDERTESDEAVRAADFRGHVFEYEADFEGFEFPGNAWFYEAGFRAGAHFNGATFRGDARFDRATFSQDSQFSGTTFHGDAWFESATFVGDARFGSATFQGGARFNRAKFGGCAWFHSAKFNTFVGFDGATFSRLAQFELATFGAHADFRNATFAGDAWFCGAKLSGMTIFEQCLFEGYTTFAAATFRKQAKFTSVQSERTFTLKGAHFKEVPDFIQAHFAEAPRLDNVRVRPLGKADPDRSARYRAVKRLAIDAHDHVREQEYFAGELKAVRGHPDRLLPNPLNWFRRDADGRRLQAWPGGARYWFGLIYQGLSDFGRSMLRPLGWWALALAGFAFGYLDRHFDRATELGRGYADGAGAWLWASVSQPLVALFPSLANVLLMPAAVASPACLVGPGEPWSAALGLSIRKALPFAGVGSTEKLNQIYACLYGIHGEAAVAGDPSARFTPMIPDSVDYLGIAQLLLSLLLLFLFLLAVRNHFRIR